MKNDRIFFRILVGDLHYRRKKLRCACECRSECIQYALNLYPECTMTEIPESDTHTTDKAQASANKDGKGSEQASDMQDKIHQQTRQTVAFWNDRQHRDLLFYLSVAIFFLELVVGVVAFLYGVIHATPAPDGGPPRFQFPWLAYILAAVVTPTALLLLVHLAGVGLFRSLRGQEQDDVWRQDLPQRLRKVFAIIQGAPTVVLLVGIMLLGAALFYIDGAMNALFQLGSTAEKYLPWIIGGVVAAWCVGYVARTWLNYRTKRMEAEFEFRREVLERTGVIIVDHGSMQLPPAGGDLDPAKALGSGQAIPINASVSDMLGGVADDAHTPQGPVLDVTPEPPQEAPDLQGHNEREGK